MKIRVCPFIVLLIGALLLGVRGHASSPTEASPNDDAGNGYLGLTVAQAEQLERRIHGTVRERGVLQSAGTLEIRNEVAGTATILFLVPDGTVVKQGDLLVELDSSS
ncbi:MAG TPA: hypothetical protein VE890_03865, partial [Thermoguttaceae bacterium]|nr:hypothetical protein [Thermoguttaceae bacterium]